MYATCYRMVVANEVGGRDGFGQANELQIVDKDGARYVNVDTTEWEGIQRAKRLGFAESRIAEVIFSPHVNEVAAELFTPEVPGKMFSIFRDPVERVISLYYYLQTATWEPTYNPALQQMSLEEYANSTFIESNWMVRALSGKRTGKLTEEDVTLAMTIYVQNFVPSKNPEHGVQSVLLLDWEKLVDAAILANAEILGIQPEMAFQHSLTGVNIEESKKRAWYPQLTAMTCSGSTPTKEPQWDTECPEDRMGRISPDGMHLCGATLGPRSSGGLACLIKCAIGADGYDFDERIPLLNQCQNVCNELFMNMNTIFVTDNDDEARSGRLEIQ